MNSKVVRNIKSRKTANDKIYTPKEAAEIMINLCSINENDLVLDPSKGGGVFYNNLPECKKEYCEIEENKDFFNYKGKPDLIIGNPPYSLWNEWIDKTIQLNPKNFCYIWGMYNFTPHRIKKIEEAGYGIKKLVFLTIDWWFSPSFIVLFEKDYKSNEIINIGKTINCPVCNTRCGRGRSRKGIKLNPNVCQFIEK